MIGLFHKHKLIIFGIAINITFFISSISTKWYDFFLFSSSIHHCCQGLDFYQIPNGAYSFFHTGSLNGALLIGDSQYGFPSNLNVYHPFLTIILGSFFLLFSAEFSFYLWMILKLIINLFIVIFIYKKFTHNQNLNFAIFFFLSNFYQYADIRISQYQFLFNIFVLLFLVFLCEKRRQKTTAFLYFLALLVKPISLLFIPLLISGKYFKILFYGLSLFFLTSAPFLVNSLGGYYIDNLKLNLSGYMPTQVDFMNLTALLHYFNIHEVLINLLKAFFLLIVVIISFIKKGEPIKAIYLAIVFFLLFYSSVYQYHYSLIIPVAFIGILTNKDFQTKFSKALLIAISFPNLFFFFRAFNIGVIKNPILGMDPTLDLWSFVLFVQITSILLLTFSIFYIYNDIKRSRILGIVKRSLLV